MSRGKKTVISAAEIPEKDAFKIGEVSRLTGVKPHVLRYWESEFRAIRPRKSPTNQRLYRKRDVEVVLTIRRLLYDEGFTIAGANRRLKELGRNRACDGQHMRYILGRLRSEVQELLEIVDEA